MIDAHRVVLFAFLALFASFALSFLSVLFALFRHRLVFRRWLHHEFPTAFDAKEHAQTAQHNRRHARRQINEVFTAEQIDMDSHRLGVGRRR